MARQQVKQLQHSNRAYLILQGRLFRSSRHPWVRALVFFFAAATMIEGRPCAEAHAWGATRDGPAEVEQC